VLSLEAVAILHGISEKTAPGRFPSYAPAHVLKAIELISSGSNVGRQQLANSLGIGEGAARTIVRRLKGEELITISRGGMLLTERGRQLLETLNNRILGTELMPTGMTVGKCDYAVVVRRAASKVGSGVEQRDFALLAGAKGATTLVYRDDMFQVPRLEFEPSQTLVRELTEKLKPGEGDVMIIGTADSMLDAEIGSKSAAIELLRQ
jgi:hypothetical protein